MNKNRDTSGARQPQLHTEKNSRSVALSILLKIENDKAYSNLALNAAIRENSLSAVDSAFVSALVYGVLEQQLLLDYIIKQYSKIPLRKIETATKIILRMGIYQLLFMDKVPDSAAVNESVNLAKKRRLHQSAGFINGILRSITRAEVKYTLPDKSDKIYYYSIKYSVPQELIRLWLNAYGAENTVALCEGLSGRPPLYARVNTLKTDREQLIAALAEDGVTAEPAALPNALRLSHTGAVERLPAYQNGLFYIQDLSSQLCVDFLHPQPRDLVLDICSAPGGKAFTAAQYMQNRGKLFACDLYDHKLRLIAQGAKRLGIDVIITKKRDGAVGEALPSADKILCDVPCSGLGILARKPEIRSKEGLLSSDLPALQYNILCHSAQYLAVGGTLIYSTCTLNPAENGDNVRRFLAEHPNYSVKELKLPEGVSRAIDEPSNELTLMPHTAGCDGFFVAGITRKR